MFMSTGFLQDGHSKFMSREAACKPKHTLNDYLLCIAQNEHYHI
jgi:hypothetical protein